MTGKDQFDKVGKKLVAEREAQKQQAAESMQNALVTLDSLRAKSSNIGMNNVGVEDILPPRMLLVQGIKDKSELVDQKGNQCPDGKFFLKGLNEILDSVVGYFVWVKKGIYSKEGNQWDGSKKYQAIMIREKDMLPFSLDFVKSNKDALSDLFTSKITQKLPLFVFKTEMKVTLAKNKEGIQFFKIVVNVKGLEDDSDKLTQLSGIADRFDQTEARVDKVEGSVDGPEEVEAQDVQDVSDDAAVDVEYDDSTVPPF